MSRIHLPAPLPACFLALLLGGAAWGKDETSGPATQPATRPEEAVRVTVDPPITVRLTFEGGKRSVLGDLVAYSELGPTLEARGTRTEYRWIEIEPRSAFIARYRLIDQENALHWLSLGEFGLAIGADDQAERALGRALRLDPSLAPEVTRIRADAPGRLRGPFQPKEPDEDADGGGGPFDLLPGTVVNDGLFEEVTPEQAARAMAAADRAAVRALERLGVKARRLETSHFVIHTDWDPVDDQFLEDALEEAYRLVAGEFGVSPERNIFVGKLPVYMFDDHGMFLRYAREIDGQEGFGKSVAGYFTTRTDGVGKMVMSKPRAGGENDLAAARRIWRRNLTHEFVHAFVARYRGNGFVPRWLNEGLAELIAEKVHSRPLAVERARRMARSGRSIAEIFNDRHLPGPEMYPVMMTLVQALHEEDPDRFVELLHRIKAGEPPERALRELFGVDYLGLEAAWRRLMTR